MESISFNQRTSFAIAASVVGVTISSLTMSPMGLLAPAAAAFLHARGRLFLLLYAATAVALVGSLMIAVFFSGATRELAIALATFFATAVCIGAVTAGASTLVASQANGPASLSHIHPDDRNAVAQATAYAFWTGVPQVVSYRRRESDGSYRQAEFRAEPGYGVGVAVDAMIFKPDDRWTTADSIGETAEAVRAAKVIESLYGKAWAFDAGGYFTYVTPAAQTAIGMTLESLNASVRGGAFIDGGDIGWSRGVHPDDYENAAATLRHCLRTGEHWHIEYRMLRTTGNYVWHRIAARPTFNDRGQITGWYGTSIDIDVYMKTVERLREREHELSQLVDMVPSHVWRLKPDGEPTFFNKRMVDYLGLDVVDMDRPSMTRLDGVIQSIVHPDDADSLRDSLGNCLLTGETFAFRYRLRRADGVYRWMSSRAEPMRDHAGSIIHWYGLCHDIEDQVRAESTLRESERRLQQLIDAVPALIWCTTPDGIPIYLNKRYTDVTGATLKDLKAPDGSPAPLAVTHPDDRAAAAEVRARAFEAGGPYVVQYRQIRRDGTYRWTETRAEALRDENGAIVQWYGVAVDIDDMVKAREALQDSERMLRQLVETLPAMIDCAAPDGEPVYRSQQLREFLGYSLEDLDDKGTPRLKGTLDAGVHPDDLPGVKEKYLQSLSAGEPYARKHRLRRHDGEYLWVETRAAPMRNAEGEIVQWNVICLDIDGEVRAEEKLRQAQERLSRSSQAASLAELSASIAHEVNQPLAAIVANSHACHRWLAAEPPNLDRARITAERIIRDANAAADVVSRIRALFRQSIETRDSSALDSVIAETHSLIAEEAARRRVQVDIDCDSHLPLIAFDRVQVQQVLINLFRNAMEAMESVAGDAILAVRVLRKGDFVQTEIRDRGEGVAFPDKVFDPFYTTKNHGMGMGLAICRSIVESHGGRLWVEKNEPRGAAFIFTLPIDMKAKS